MCAICFSNPCHPACPNARDPEPVFICTRCGDGILEGNKYFDSPDGPICESCLSMMRARTILQILGEELTTAEKEDM